MSAADTGKRTKIIIIAVTAAVLVIAAVVCVLIFSGNSEEAYRSVSVKEVAGDVTVENKGEVYKAYPEMKLSDGFSMTTAAKSYSFMSLDDEKFVKLEEESRARFEAVGTKGKSTSIKLEYGVLSNEIVRPLRSGEEYTVTTPNAVMAVRGTLFTAKTKRDSNGKWLTDIYTFGGTVSSRRIMPDGTVVNEEVLIRAGYKATLKTDDGTTYYIDEKTGEPGGGVAPIDIEDIDTDILVFVYTAAQEGHDVCFTPSGILEVFEKRGVDVTQYNSYRTGKPLSAAGASAPEEPEPETDGAAENTEITDETDIAGASDTSGAGDTIGNHDTDIPDSSGGSSFATAADSSVTDDTTLPPAPGTYDAGDTTIPVVTSATTTGYTSGAPDDAADATTAGTTVVPGAEETTVPDTSASGSKTLTAASSSATSPGDTTTAPEVTTAAESTAGTTTVTAATTAQTTTTGSTSDSGAVITTGGTTARTTAGTTSETTSETTSGTTCSHTYGLKNITLVSGSGDSAVFEGLFVCSNCMDKVIVKGTVTLFARMTDGCTKYYIDFICNGMTYSDTYIAPCTHDFSYQASDKPTFVWSPDHTGCSAGFSCLNGCGEYKNVTCTVTKTVSASVTVYKAVCVFNGITFTDIYEEGTVSDGFSLKEFFITDTDWTNNSAGYVEKINRYPAVSISWTYSKRAAVTGSVHYNAELYVNPLPLSATRSALESLAELNGKTTDYRLSELGRSVWTASITEENVTAAGGQFTGMLYGNFPDHNNEAIQIGDVCTWQLVILEVSEGGTATEVFVSEPAEVTVNWGVGIPYLPTSGSAELAFNWSGDLALTPTADISYEAEVYVWHGWGLTDPYGSENGWINTLSWSDDPGFNVIMSTGAWQDGALYWFNNTGSSSYDTPPTLASGMPVTMGLEIYMIDRSSGTPTVTLLRRSPAVEFSVQ